MRDLLCVFVGAWKGLCLCAEALRSFHYVTLWCVLIIVQKLPRMWISRFIMPNVISSWFPKENPRSISIGALRLKHRFISNDTLLLFPKCLLYCESENLRILIMNCCDSWNFGWIWIVEMIMRNNHELTVFVCRSLVRSVGVLCVVRRGCGCYSNRIPSSVGAGGRGWVASVVSTSLSILRVSGRFSRSSAHCLRKKPTARQWLKQIKSAGANY